MFYWRKICYFRAHWKFDFFSLLTFLTCWENSVKTDLKSPRIPWSLLFSFSYAFLRPFLSDVPSCALNFLHNCQGKGSSELTHQVTFSFWNFHLHWEFLPSAVMCWLMFGTWAVYIQLAIKAQYYKPFPFAMNTECVSLWDIWLRRSTKQSHVWGTENRTKIWWFWRKGTIFLKT